MFDLGSKMLIIVRYPSPACKESTELKDILMNETIINFDKTFAVWIKFIALIFTFHYGFEPFLGCPLLRLLCFILLASRTSIFVMILSQILPGIRYICCLWESFLVLSLVSGIDASLCLSSFSN